MLLAERIKSGQSDGVTDRVRVSTAVETSILLASRRRCCVCFGLDNDLSRKKGQISHIDRNSSNSAPSNLAYLCLDHHDELDTRTSQSKGLTKAEVRAYRDALVASMAEYHLTALDTFGDRLGRNDETTPHRGDVSAAGGWRLLFQHSDDAGIEGPLFIGDTHELLIVKRPRIFSYQPGDPDLRLRLDGSPYVERFQQDEARPGWVASNEAVSVWPLAGGSLAVFNNDLNRGDAEPEILTKHTSEVTFGGFGQSGDTFISADEAGIIKIWDWPAKSVRTPITTLLRSIVSVAIDASEEQLIAASEDGQFESFALKPVRSLGKGSAAVRGLALRMWFTLDQGHLAANDDYGRWDVFDRSSLERLPEERWYEVFVHAAQDASKKKFLLQAANGIIAYSELKSGRLDEESVDAFPPFNQRVSSFALSKDGRYAALAHERRSLFVWERLTTPTG